MNSWVMKDSVDQSCDTFSQNSVCLISMISPAGPHYGPGRGLAAPTHAFSVVFVILQSHAW